MTRESCERVIVQLILDGVLKEDFHFTPFATVAYIVEGPRKDLAVEGRVAVNLDFLTEDSQTCNDQPTQVSSEIRSVF